jgi:hypothetical protein
MLHAKQFLTICLLVMAPFAIFAQFEKGTNSIGGSGKLALTYQEPEPEVNVNGDTVLTRRKYRNVSLSTSYFRFVSEKVALGMGVDWGIQQNSTPYKDQGTWKVREDFTHSIGFYPSLRYHIPVHERWQFFLENHAGGKAVFQKRTVPRNGELLVDENLRYELQAGVTPGMLVMVTPKWSVEARVPNVLLLSGQLIPGDNVGTNSFNIYTNILDNFSLGSIKVSVRYYF